jgi:hypothetical protein
MAGPSTVLEPPPTRSAGAAPLRRPFSIRRTSSMEADWPGGFGTPTCIVGRARDLVTLRDISRPQVLDGDSIEIWASIKREIISIKTSRHNDIAQALVGERGGSGFRQSLNALFSDERLQGSPLHLLLDDYPGASLVAGWAWTRWMEDAQERRQAMGAITAGRSGRMEGVCVGFKPGSSALAADGSVKPRSQSFASVAPLQHAHDLDGWHVFSNQDGVGMRRARRTDVWLDDRIRMNMSFQDSATTPAGGRVAVHEYMVSASADPGTLELLEVEATPQVLPYRECPGAARNVSRLVGLSLTTLRAQVGVQLSGVLGCTHLNDLLRSMSDVPGLVDRVRQSLDTQM